MQFSEQWLREWVNPPVDTATLAAQLTMAGLEVDAITPVAGEFTGVVVGKVLSVAPHPDADRLRVCQVEVGAEAPLGIVCGAANVAPGLNVPAALIGAALPGGLSIKRSKLRGVESFGMLCSAKELGLAETAEGLLILPADAVPGTDIRACLQLDDRSIELGLTPNRGDCLSIAGVAREVGVLNRLAVRGPDIGDVAPAIDERFPVEIQAPEDCPRYIGRVIRGIDTGAQTPLWMQERLRRCGLRSLGPVVDVTNYVMLELGQPMHAFDLGRLEGGIRVRPARAGETLVMLDGKALALQENTLLIADHVKPLALAGIMGGKDSGVSDATRDLFLESAFFAPQRMAGKARLYGLHTDSSHRFERGVDPTRQRQVVERATRLLLDIVGGKAGPVIECASPAHLPARPPIPLRAARLARLLGVEIPAGEVREILERLAMQVDAREDGWEVVPPPFRFDISIEEDLVEEVGRVYGYNRLPVHRPLGALAMAPHPETSIGRATINRLLTARGYQETITYSFVDPRLQALLDPQAVPRQLANPISADMAVMRTNLWSGLVQTLVRNLNRQQPRIQIFESGMRFVTHNYELKQETVISGLRYGATSPEQWGEARRPADFYDIKGDVEALLGLASLEDTCVFTPGGHPALHPGRSATVTRDAQVLGWLGALHPAVQQALDLPQSAFLFELTLAALQFGQLPRFTEVSRFPAIRRDLALVADEALAARQVARCIRDGAGELLQELTLFDMYKGKGIDSGKKSLAFGLILQHHSHTLTDEEVEVVVSRVLALLNAQLGVKLRD